MGLKTAGVGHFTIPTAPAAGTSCTSGAANTFTTTYVQLIASTAAALYITGIYVEAAAAAAWTYVVVQLATGGAGSETVVGQHLVQFITQSTTILGYKPIFPPIPVANAARIACKTADSLGSKATLITLECINQSNVVDDGIAMSANPTQWLGGTIPAVNVTGVPKVDVVDVNGNATAAAVMALLYGGFENGTAQAGGTNTITLRAGASAVDNFYNDQVVFTTGGTGAGQTNRVMRSVGSTKVCTMETNWATQPDATTTYVVLGRVG